MTGGHGQESLLLRPLPTKLPKVEFWKIKPKQPHPRGVDDPLYHKFGYNDIDEVWQPSPTYTRWVQPSQEELAHQVEYDMTDADQIWLDSINAERKKEGLDMITYEFFEIIMDKLEKEWFDLQKHFPKPASNLLVEDSKCTICDDGECEASNAIVFCDGCNLAVHQDCYGVPYIPEGQWLCRKCTVSPDRPVSCLLCPREHGAFKQTVNGQWAHLLCAIWINETWVCNTVYMEPIDGIESIPKSRWRLICNLCKKRSGACIQCSKSSCYAAYHVTCARERGLYLKLGTSSGATTTDGSAGPNISYCDKHSRQAYIDDGDDERAVSEEVGGTPGPSRLPERKKTRKLQAYGDRHDSSHADADDSFASRDVSFTQDRAPIQTQTTTRSVPKAELPIIPRYIYEKLWEHLKPIRCQKKQAFVRMVCRYWSLKRQARHGAPLLKRLHLEPWTASGGAIDSSDVQREQTLELILHLRSDLDKVRGMIELVRRREVEKLRRAQLFKQVIDALVFPQTGMFRATLRRLQQLDGRQLFLKPVSKTEVPDYHVIVKEPMDWQTMHKKLDENAYVTAQDFKHDVELITHNALLYNVADSPHGKAAIKLRNAAGPILAQLDEYDNPSSALRQKHRRYLDLVDEDFIHNLMKVDYPLPDQLPTDSADTLMSTGDTSVDLANLSRVGIPAILTSRQRRPGKLKKNKRKFSAIDPDAAPGFKAPRQSFVSFSLDADGSASTEQTAAKGPVIIHRKQTEEETREKKRQHNRDYRAKKKAEKAARLGLLVPPPIASAAPATQAAPTENRRQEIDNGTSNGAGPSNMQIDMTVPETAPNVVVPEAPAITIQAESEEPPEVAAAISVEQQTIEEPAEDTTADVEMSGEDAVVDGSPAVADMAISAPAPELPELEQAVQAHPVQGSIVDGEEVPTPRVSEFGGIIDREDVPDDHEAYLLFNTGWILPEGSKRRRASSANTETSLVKIKSRNGSLPAASVSPVLRNLTLPQSAPMPSIALPPVQEQSPPINRKPHQTSIFPSTLLPPRTDEAGQASSANPAHSQDTPTHAQSHQLTTSVSTQRIQNAQIPAAAAPALPSPSAMQVDDDSELSDIEDYADSQHTTDSKFAAQLMQHKPESHSAHGVIDDSRHPRVKLPADVVEHVQRYEPPTAVDYSAAWTDEVHSHAHVTQDRASEASMSFNRVDVTLDTEDSDLSELEDDLDLGSSLATMQNGSSPQPSPRYQTMQRILSPPANKMTPAQRSSSASPAKQSTSSTRARTSTRSMSPAKSTPAYTHAGRRSTRTPRPEPVVEEEPLLSSQSPEPEYQPERSFMEHITPAMPVTISNCDSDVGHSEVATGILEAEDATGEAKDADVGVDLTVTNAVNTPALIEDDDESALSDVSEVEEEEDKQSAGIALRQASVKREEKADSSSKTAPTAPPSYSRSRRSSTRPVVGKRAVDATSTEPERAVTESPAPAARTTAATPTAAAAALKSRQSVQRKTKTTAASTSRAANNESAKERRATRQRTRKGGGGNNNKIQPSRTISHKTLREVYHDKPSSFVQTRLDHLLPFVRYNNIEEVEDYDLVWARTSKNAPYWPAEVCLDIEEREGDVPQLLIDEDPNEKIANGESVPLPGRRITDQDRTQDKWVLVQWFPQSRSTWSWIPFNSEYMTRLGESKEYDGIMQNKFPLLLSKKISSGGVSVNNSAIKKKKATDDIKKIRKAYEDAFTNMETPPPSDEDEELQDFSS